MKAKKTNSAGHFAYISGAGKYKNKSDIIHVESHNMPNCEASDFWLTCQKSERANANLFKEFEISLARELSDQENALLVEKLRMEMIPNQPATVAIHKGRNGDNPHAHIMFSMRKNDNVQREELALFFRRANKKHPERGGAPKLDEWRGKEFILDARKRWEVILNDSLSKLKTRLPKKVSCLSLKERGIPRKPQLKYGHIAVAINERGEHSTRIERCGIYNKKFAKLSRMAKLLLRKNKERDRSR
jgi:hypothetical protein